MEQLAGFQYRGIEQDVPLGRGEQLSNRRGSTTLVATLVDGGQG